MRRLTAFLTGLALLWAGGLVLFIAALPKPAEQAPDKVEGVAVYTGGGGTRISTAMAIFADGAGERLLISGVHPDTSAARLSDFWVGPKDQFDCCVDLGREALSTEGNAGELNAWATSHRFNNIILVTSDYHMPRALTESRITMPDVEITPHPVASGYLNANGAPASRNAWGKLAGEYNKYILAKAKALLSSVGQ